MTNTTRLKKVSLSLTPAQAVRAWMSEAHRFPSAVEYMLSLVGRPDAEYPLFRLPDQAEHAVRVAMRGHDRELVEGAVRQAIKEVCFLFHLHQRTNDRVVAAEEELNLRLCWLIDGLLDLLAWNARQARLDGVRWELDTTLPYPLESEAAAAVTAAMAHAVEPWQDLADGGTVEDWVTSACPAEGKTALTFCAALLRTEKPERNASMLPVDGELRACFANEADHDAFRAGSDFSYGLADVPDAEYTARHDAVEQALRELIAQEPSLGGRVLRLASVPCTFLRELPLVEGEWLDAYGMELAEWGALAMKRGFRLKEQEGEHPLALHCFRQSEDSASDVGAAAALRPLARTHLARFPGRRRLIDNRPYLHAADYENWRGRWVKGALFSLAQSGIAITAWNAWIESHREDGPVTLAGVPVEPLGCYATEYPFSAHDTGEASRQQERRRRLYADFQGDGGQRGPESADRRRTMAGRFAAWRERAVDLLGRLLVEQGVVRTVAQRSFGGQELLYPHARHVLTNLIERTEELVRLFEGAFPFSEAGSATGTATPVIDSTAIARGRQPVIAVGVTGIVELAKAMAFDDVGERRATHELVERTLLW